MGIHIKITGVILMALALLHLIFPRYFNWEKELPALSLINRQMMVVHTFFIALMVFLMGLLCLSSADELIETSLGKKIALGLGVFWSIRLFIQFFGYSADLWKGKAFETLVHILFSLLWAYVSIVFWVTHFN
jgi:hypothetical protein